MDIIKFIVHLTTVIIAFELISHIWLVLKFIKRTPTRSIFPLILSVVPGFWVLFYSILTWVGFVKIILPVEWVIITRGTMMLLMGCPVWILLALSNLPCVECIYKIERRTK